MAGDLGPKFRKISARKVYLKFFLNFSSIIPLIIPNILLGYQEEEKNGGCRGVLSLSLLPIAWVCGSISVDSRRLTLPFSHSPRFTLTHGVLARLGLLELGLKDLFS
jgi:hypothetical protein